MSLPSTASSFRTVAIALVGLCAVVLILLGAYAMARRGHKKPAGGKPGGTTVQQQPGGTTVQQQPGGTTVQQQPGGTAQTNPTTQEPSRPSGTSARTTANRVQSTNITSSVPAWKRLLPPQYVAAIGGPSVLNSLQRVPSPGDGSCGFHSFLSSMFHLLRAATPARATFLSPRSHDGLRAICRRINGEPINPKEVRLGPLIHGRPIDLALPPGYSQGLAAQVAVDAPDPSILADAARALDSGPDQYAQLGPGEKAALVRRLREIALYERLFTMPLRDVVRKGEEIQQSRAEPPEFAFFWEQIGILLAPGCAHEIRDEDMLMLARAFKVVWYDIVDLEDSSTLNVYSGGDGNSARVYTLNNGYAHFDSLHPIGAAGG